MFGSTRSAPNPWAVLDADEDGDKDPAGSPPVLVTLHFLRSSLRRRRGLFLLAAGLGLAIAGAWLAFAPGQHKASVVLVMAHKPGVDAVVSMRTDVRLTSARPVGSATALALGGRERPEEILRSVQATGTTGDILTIAMTANSDQEAVRRLAAFTRSFLAFRAQQFTNQAGLRLNGMNAEIVTLQRQADRLSQKTDALPITAAEQRDLLITQRAQVVNRISSLEQSVQETTLQTASIVAGSRVIDSVDVTQPGGKRRIVLVLITGLIGGSALGGGLLLFQTVMSNRLHRRVDVATALEIPISASTGKLRPVPAVLRSLPGLRTVQARRAVDRDRIARVIQRCVPPPGGGQWLIVGCVDNAGEVRYAAVAAAQNLLQAGYVVHLIDLTEKGQLARTVSAMRIRSAPGQLTVSHPRVMAALASDLSDMQTLGIEPGQDFPWSPEDIYLTVADLSPDTTMDHLTLWADRMVVAVTSGRSTPDRLRTAVDRIEAAEIEICAAVLMRSEAHDESSGHGVEQVPVSPDPVQFSPV